MTGYHRVRVPGPVNTFGQIREPFFTPYTVTKAYDSPYPTIASAIAAAKAQAAIDSLPKLVLVGPGTYVESLVYSTGGEDITVRGESDIALSGRDLKETSFTTSTIEGSVIIHGLEPIESECIQVTLTSTSASTIRFENITFFKNQNTGRIVKIIGLPTGTHLVEFRNCRMVKKGVTNTSQNPCIEVFSGGAGTTISFIGCYMLLQPSSLHGTSSNTYTIKTSTTKNYSLNIIDCHVEMRHNNATSGMRGAVISINSTSFFRPYVVIDGCEITNAEGLTGDTANSLANGIEFLFDAKSGGAVITNNVIDSYYRGISILLTATYTGTDVIISGNTINYARLTLNSVAWGIYIAGNASFTTEMYDNTMNCHQSNATFRNASVMFKNGAAVSTIIIECGRNRFLGAEAPGNDPNVYEHASGAATNYVITAGHGEPTKQV